MDDPQRQPRDPDRAQLSARIRGAADQGRISTADRDIRLSNVRNAQSVAELDLMTRELDQLDAALPVSPVPGPAPYARFDPAPPRASSSSAGPRTALVAILVAVAVVLAGVAGLIGFLAQGSESVDTFATPVPEASTAAGPEESRDEGEPATPTGPAYSLTAAGVRGFLATYRQRFRTTQVVELTLYGDYVIVNVPVAGRSRQTGWLFRPGTGFTSFGGTRASFPGSRPVDVRRLDVTALMRNVARARRTLNVERPTQTYAVIRFIRGVDDQPRVDVHVANGFGESGYLATTLAGQVRRAFPYAA